MKTNFNKSEILKNAWFKFKTSSDSFSNCLKSAWMEAKNITKKVIITVKEAFEMINLFDFKNHFRSNESNEIIKLVAEKGNGIAKKIAESFRYNEKIPSQKQSWCIAFEYINLIK